MMAFVLGSMQGEAIRRTAADVRAALPEATVFAFTSHCASLINEQLSRRHDGPFLTIRAGTKLAAAFRHDLKQALLRLDQPRIGWITLTALPPAPSPGKLDADDACILWNAECINGGLFDGFPNRAFQPFEPLVLIDRQYESGRSGWSGARLSAVSLRFAPSRSQALKNAETERKLILPLIAANPHAAAPAARPKVSIALCTFNDSRYLPWAIRSVLAQTCSDWELLVIDDGSTDETSALMARFQADPRIRYVRLPVNAGKSSALNKALQLAKGDWMLELDADDWLAPDGVETLLAAAAKAPPDTALLYGPHHQWIERLNGELVYKGPNAPPPADLVRSGTWLMRGIPIAPRFYRKSALLKVNGWTLNDPSQGRLYEDFEMILRLSSRFPIASADQALYHRRIRQSSVSQRNKQVYAHWKNWLLNGRNR
jgi:hypothetical protein